MVQENLHHHHPNNTKNNIATQATTEYRLLSLVRDVVEKRTKESHVLGINDALEQIPKFQESELEVGRVLGRGGFCVVSEIVDISLTKGSIRSNIVSDDELNETKDEDDEDEVYFNRIVQGRTYMESHCLRQGKDCRYAIKRLHANTRKDTSKLFGGIVDLAMEARFLSVLCHPNIITLRGTAAGTPYDDNFFLILDHLYDTLTLRILKWKKQQTGGLRKQLLDRNGKKETALYVERCLVAYDLARALWSMHVLNIMYRDVKSDNVGFDVRGSCKLFDFDLVKEFDPQERNQDGTYNLTAQTGSMKYMAPEIALGKPYNESVDVYSFCILLWQIIQLEPPFDQFNMRMMEKYVIRGGARPKCDPKWSPQLSELMKHGWSTNWHQRPTMEDVAICLKEEINRCTDDDELLLDEIMDSERETDLSFDR